MMKMKFTNYGATILFEKNCINFEQTDNKVAGVSVFKNETTDMMATFIQGEETIKKIIEMRPVDYIFVCDIKMFNYMLKNTETQELDVEMFLNKKREIMPYTIFGVSPALLIISCIK